ncbi:MAG TPA: hypothetical protein VGN52_15925 [Burkholderiales bacterium]
MSKKERSSQNPDKQNLNQGSQKQSQSGGPSHASGTDKQKQQQQTGNQGGGFANWEKSHEKEINHE